ncbi:AAA family ATPase [Stieleria sp. TO1_6]|nr:YhaN family protein [Stieleria tagensis]MCO8123979.1 AAA family ATPase [Stieleria tagensis]
MIIQQLNLKAFGRFSDQTLDLSAGPRRFHIVYGPNESGKSTCLRAISSLFYGIPTRTTDNYRHGNAKLRIGATLIDQNGQPLTVIRRKNGKTKLHAADDKTPIDEAVLQQLLGGVDESAFHHRFGLSHDQLVEGGQAVLDSKGELGEILFAAGAGVGRLKAIQAKLDEESKELFLERGKKAINVYLKELDEKRTALRDLQTLPTEYRSLRTQLSEAEQRSTEQSAKLAQLQSQLEKRRAHQNAIPIVPVWLREKQRVAEFEGVPTLDADFTARRREATTDRINSQRQVDELSQELKSIQDQIDQTPTGSNAIEHQQEIVGLFQAIAARQAASNDQHGLRRVVQNHNRHLQELLRDLEIEIPDGNADHNAADDSQQQQIDRLIAGLHVSDATRMLVSELTANYQALRQQERISDKKVQTLQTQLADLERELEQTSDIGDCKQLDSVIADVGAPAALLEPAEQQLATCQQLHAECERLFAELNVDAMDMPTAIALRLPTSDEIDRHDDTQNRLTSELKSAKQEHQKRLTRQQQLRDELNQLQADGPLPTEQQLAQSRTTRDQWVEQVDSAADDAVQVRAHVHSVRTSIRDSDDVVDTIRKHQQQVAKRDAAVKELQQLEREIQLSDESVALAQALIDQADTDWQQIWQSRGVISGSVREMRRWISSHELLVNQHAALQQAENNRKAAETKVDRATSRLKSAVQMAWAARTADAPAQTLDFDTMGLESLYDAASSLRTQINQAAVELADLKRRRLETQTALPSAQAEHQSNVQLRKEWDTQWKQTTQSFAGGRHDPPNVIGERISKIQEMFQEKRERDIVLGRIRSIDNDNESFAQRVAVVADLVGLQSPPALTSAQVAQLLHQTLQDATTALNQRKRLVSDFDDRNAKLNQANERLQRAIGTLTELCREAGVQSAEQLPELEEASTQKRAAMEAMRNAETQLALIAGKTSIESFAAEAQSHDPGELAAEIQDLERQIADLNQQREAIQQEVGGLKKELSRIDGGDRAAELNQSLQLLTGRIERESQQYAKLRIAAMILQRAIEHYRSENESPVLAIACKAFEDLTCGRYIGLKPEFDDRGRSRLYGVERTDSGEESLVAVDTMSLGTADALYLAMRLASLEHQLSAGVPIPVVIDDCLIQLDDDRAIAAMKRFSSLSERTQVILFTHHQHLVDLAQSELGEGNCHLHRLSE